MLQLPLKIPTSIIKATDVYILNVLINGENIYITKLYLLLILLLLRGY
jgi:hypothetical protein